MSSGAGVFIGTWIGGAVVGGGLFALSKTQFPTVGEKTERQRKLILIGLVPCCGLNIFLAIVYYLMFLAKAKYDSSRDKRAEAAFQRKLGGAAPSAGGNPFGGTSSPSGASPGAPGPNPFGAPPAQSDPGPGSGGANPFGDPPPSDGSSPDNPFA